MGQVKMTKTRGGKYGFGAVKIDGITVHKRRPWSNAHTEYTRAQTKALASCEDRHLNRYHKLKEMAPRE